VSALWTVAEVAAWARVDASTLRRWARSGQVAHTRVGTRIRFNDAQRAAVAEVREAREHTPANPWGLSPQTRRRTA
jgi:excisionase family DNA binding protein